MDPESNSLYPIAVLIDELKSDEVSRRINSVQQLSNIAVALGQERTRNELIPYLSELMDDEEEVLVALAQNLGKMVDHVGGKQYAHVLFGPLQELCQVEDPSVRVAAVDSFKEILNQVDTVALQPVILDVLKRLSYAEWFSAKIGAANLLPISTNKLKLEAIPQVLEILKNLLEDNHPQVRKAAAESLKSLTHLAQFQENLLDCLNLLSDDKEDSVRLLAVENLTNFMESLPGAKPKLVRILRKLLEDTSWRIRYLLAEKVSEIGSLLNAEERVSILCPSFVKFLQDEESEVRTAACSKVGDYSALLEAEEVASHILPVLSPLANDVDYVKAALASHINQLCPIVGKARTNQYLMSVILSLLKDESPDIRMCLFNDLESINQVIGAENLAQGIMPAVTDLSEDKNWRIRQQVVETLPVLGKQLGKEFFDQHLAPIFKKLLTDQVFSVREKAIESIGKLVECFGSAWLEERLLDEILEAELSESYLRRLTTVIAAQSIAETVSKQALSGKIVPVVLNLVSDPVPNVRLNVAKAIKKIYSLVNEASLTDQIKTALRVLNKDEDIDVRYFAEQAQKTCH